MKHPLRLRHCVQFYPPNVDDVETAVIHLGREMIVARNVAVDGSFHHVWHVGGELDRRTVVGTSSLDRVLLALKMDCSAAAGAQEGTTAGAAAGAASGAAAQGALISSRCR